MLVYPSGRIAYRFTLDNKITRGVLRCKAKTLAGKVIVRESIAPTYCIANIILPSSDGGFVLKIVGGAFDNTIVQAKGPEINHISSVEGI